ncbi:MAG TPA: VWA domain-containing protein [Thermoanaerobaculia bacterium]
MRRGLLIAVALLLISNEASAQKLGPVDWIFLVDTSKSMRGIGRDTKDIFGDVKESLKSFVRETNDGDTVAIFTFDRKVSPIAKMDVSGLTRADLYESIEQLKAEGDRTHLGAAIAKGLDRAEFLRTHSDPTRARAVVLFTDGKEDIRGIENPTHINANLAGTSDSYVYFVSMGKEHEKQLDEFAKSTPRATVLRATTREQIRAMAQTIRRDLPKPTPPPPIKEKPATPPPPPPPPSPWMRALRWLIELAILGGIAIFLLQQQRKKNRLEGEIEILRPQTAPDLAFVGLPKLQASEVMLSAILPLDALSGGDARLFVKRKDGKKKIWISAAGGGLRINDVDTPVSELYDADTIEIGTAKLRFNRVGDERPYDVDSAH